MQMDFTQMHETETSGHRVGSGRMINVNGSDEPTYRYKMPALETRIIGKSGGTTVITNIDAVASAIFRSVDDLKPVFTRGIAGKVKMTSKGLELAGKWDGTALQKMLQKYIDKHVLCPKCRNPETPLRGKVHKCLGCGYKINA